MLTRNSDQNKDHFDLLPFIAILMCLLGCLLLVTLSIAALSLGVGVGEGWIPTSDEGRAAKTPVLIEWDGKAALIHRPGRRTRAAWTPAFTRAELGDGPLDFAKLSELLSRKEKQALDPALRELLDELAAQSATHYALFAVRPSGFETFDRFADLFRDRKIDVGYEPIAQEKSVRLLSERRPAAGKQP
jgi:hypothetical protein